jgi:NAD(P)H-dependent FMN reductase
VDRQRLRVAVVTPENRVGTWVAGQGRRRDGLEVGVIDLAGPAVAVRLAAAEAFVLVTPGDEVPAALRQAVGSMYCGWRAKPVAFVWYGSGSGAAIRRLRAVFAELHVVLVNLTVAAFDVAAATAMFEQLEWWGRALRDPAS